MGQFVRDSMTGTGYADLDDPAEHSTEVGGPWVRNGATPDTRWYLFSDRCHCGSIGAIYASGTPSSADYYVEADYIIYTDSQGPLLCVRMSTTAQTYYGVRYQGEQYVLSKFIAGVEAWIGTPWAPASPHRGTHKLKLDVLGTAIKVYVDGVLVISVTDTSITAPGKAGLASPFATQDVGSGKHIDNFIAVDGATAALRATVFALID